MCLGPTRPASGTTGVSSGQGTDSSLTARQTCSSKGGTSWTQVAWIARSSRSRWKPRDRNLGSKEPALPISPVMDQGAALRAARAVSRPAASRPGRLRRRRGEPPTAAGPPPRTPLTQTQDDHGQAARKPAGRPDRRPGLPTAAPVQPQDWLAPGLPPRPGKPHGSLSRSLQAWFAPGRQLLGARAFAAPEEP